MDNKLYKHERLKELDFSATKGHAWAFYHSEAAYVREYDPTADGPEVGLINREAACRAWDFLEPFHG